MVEEVFFPFFFFFLAEWQNESGQDLKGIRKVVPTGSWGQGAGKRKPTDPRPKSPGVNARSSSAINQLRDSKRVAAPSLIITGLPCTEYLRGVS